MLHKFDLIKHLNFIEEDSSRLVKECLLFVFCFKLTFIFEMVPQ